MTRVIKGHIFAEKQLYGHLANRDSINGHISCYRGAGSGKLPWYEGEYSVTPRAYDEQILQTANKSMRRNVTVHKVPKFDVDNPFGGKTISIALEV